jgi:GNAT superfamily N-acetyltransferase
MSALSFREGRASDLRATFELGEAALDASRKERGLLPPEHRRGEDDLAARWERERGLLEFIVAQADGRFVICDDGEQMVGYTRIARFGEMDELTELWVAPSHAGHGVGRGLLERCWPKSPTPELGRVVLGIGRPADLTLYTQFGVMPVSGHWHMRQRRDEYLERRSQEIDGGPPPVHALTPDRAVAEWKRLEPTAIGHERPLLHEFFGRTRTCLATIDAERGEATGLCWISPDGDIGPAVGEAA